MDIETKHDINKDSQIKKFSLYGLLKNLKFFEPYLIIYLMGSGLNLFHIGLLYSVKEITINIMEIPSGLMSDYFGRKKELMSCFVFYIISFIFFFFTDNFLLAAAGMFFFGLGEAFRSGTHKAIIYTYLEKKGWQKYKTFVYGRTRSFSLIGSMLSALLAIILILNVPACKYIFLASILPYILDFILISSYPKELNFSGEKCKTFKAATIQIYNNLKKKRALRSLIIQNSLFEAGIDFTKDLVQPMLKAIILSSGAVAIIKSDAGSTTKICLGLTYAFIYLFSSVASRNAYRIKEKGHTGKLLNIIYIMLAATLLLIGIFGNTYIIILLFLAIYILFNIRKPIYLDEIDSHMEKNERVTILSISSQMKSLLTIIISPAIGYMATKFGFSAAIVSLSFLLFTFYFISKCKS